MIKTGNHLPEVYIRRMNNVKRRTKVKSAIVSMFPLLLTLTNGPCLYSKYWYISVVVPSEAIACGSMPLYIPSNFQNHVLFPTKLISIIDYCKSYSLKTHRHVITQTAALSEECLQNVLIFHNNNGVTWYSLLKHKCRLEFERCPYYFDQYWQGP